MIAFRSERAIVRSPFTTFVSGATIRGLRIIADVNSAYVTTVAGLSIFKTDGALTKF
ncbi:hypothetical protein K4039_00925 [Lyngbya sp. CCAP 1446/10]|uniref:hypothetical protein n=1 Tax=Microcoleaceae TaxID=1892252 RepID=UPI00223889D8|nr:hypothetical protein [Lyngbya sp. CCAP 1446/10]MCW6048677.1 hypothetical protein [Lyngbya sp. CCAP 1446/10]